MSQTYEPFVIIEDIVAIGFDEGLDKGLIEGRAAGRLAMARENVLELLEVRGLLIEPSERARIESERSLDRLMTWLRRAATCASTAELLLP